MIAKGRRTVTIIELNAEPTPLTREGFRIISSKGKPVSLPDILES